MQTPTEIPEGLASIIAIIAVVEDVIATAPQGVDFRCECDTPERHRCIVTGHDGSTVAVDYCDGCFELAEVDWNGETASVVKVGPSDVLDAYFAIEAGVLRGGYVLGGSPNGKFLGYAAGHAGRVQAFVDAMDRANPPRWAGEMRVRMTGGTASYVQAFVADFGWIHN